MQRSGKADLDTSARRLGTVLTRALGVFFLLADGVLRRAGAPGRRCVRSRTSGTINLSTCRDRQNSSAAWPEVFFTCAGFLNTAVNPNSVIGASECFHLATWELC